MITPVYKGCSACNGSGTVETYPNPVSSTSIPGIPTSIICQVCKGGAIVPTGDFVFNHIDHIGHTDTRSVLEQIEDLPEWEKQTIKNKFL